MNEEYITIKSRNPACGLVRDALEHQKITQEKASTGMNVSKALLSSIVNYKRDVSVELALKLEAYLGVDANFLMKVQTSWKLRQAKKTLSEKILEIKPVTAA